MKYNYYRSLLFVLLLCLLVIPIIIFTIRQNNNKQNNNNKQCEEGFTNIDKNRKWSCDLIRRFVLYQTTINQNNNQFNLEVLQQQATPEEAEHLLKTGFWPWSDSLKYNYLDKVWSNPIIKIEPHYALNYAMNLYNEHAANELLGWNAKEGEFLLYGGDLGVSPELSRASVKNTIKCSTDKDGNSIMQKKIYTGMNLWNGYMNSTTQNIKNENIPKEMPGFSFIKGPCNPCVALNDVADFSCPFILNIKGDTSTSPSWATLWGL